jgi:hypothetical protein
MLLCDFHIHTNYSDGVLPMSKVVDLFGRSGHDVIAITDHIVNEDSGLGRIAHRIRHSLNSRQAGQKDSQRPDVADREKRPVEGSSPGAREGAAGRCASAARR